MGWLRTIWSETVGLFVDDTRFAGAIVVWLVVAGLLLPRLPVPSWLPPLILFAGLVAILAESAWRQAREQR